MADRDDTKLYLLAARWPGASTTKQESVETGAAQQEGMSRHRRTQTHEPVLPEKHLRLVPADARYDQYLLFKIK